MILVAESGSTKTQWCSVTDGNIEILVNTPGINPLLLSIEEIKGAIRPVTAGKDAGMVEKVYFFGAGCNSKNAREKIAKAINSLFKNAILLIDSDLIAACLALAGDNPGIIGLLGTGSNSCLWDGASVIKNVPSLGYILGDEGGGVSMGKELISDFLKNQMPLHLRKKFIEKYDISASIVIDRVYQKPMPNRYLAGFAPFPEIYLDEDYCQRIISGQFERFVVRNLLQYRNHSQIETYFCGSIAFSYRETLKAVCEKYSITIGKIVKEPIIDLVNFLKEKGKL